MYQSILVPLDGSAFPTKAVPLAAAIARRTGARLYLALVPDSTATVLRQAAAARGMSTAPPDAYLRRVETLVATESDNTVIPTVVELAGPEALPAVMDEHGVDLVVMTTHGRGGLFREWLGMVGGTILRNTVVPLFLHRPGGGRGPDLTEQVRNILIPVSGGGVAATESAIEPGVRVGRLTGARLTLLRVVPPAFRYGGGPARSATAIDRSEVERRCAAARAELDALARRLAEHVPGGVETATTVYENPAVGILNHAEEHQADLIALASDGAPAARPDHFGPVVDEVLRGATGPVLLYRLPGPASPSER